jgi:hypothetical protein
MLRSYSPVLMRGFSSFISDATSLSVCARRHQVASTSASASQNISLSSASMSAPGRGCAKTRMFKVSQRDQVPREAGLMFGSLPNARISVEAPELPTLAMIPKRCIPAQAGASHCFKAKKFFRPIISGCLPSPRVSV